MKRLKIVFCILGILAFIFLLRYGGAPGMVKPNGMPSRELGETAIALVVIFIFIPSAIIGGIIAWNLKRSPLFYGILSLLMPYILCFVMSFLKEREEAPRTLTMTCSSCNKTVSQYSKPGQQCPYCGVTWDSEKNLTGDLTENKFLRLFRW